MNVLAVDVSKDELVCFDSQQIVAIPNKAKAIHALLAKYPGWAIVLEPTSTYHLELAERAHRQGRTVYLVNPRDLKHFRESRSFRAKTDALDAQYLHEYVQAHWAKMRPWVPMKVELRKLKDAIRRWFHLSQMRSKFAQVWHGQSGEDVDCVLDALEKLMEATEKEAVQLAKAVDAECYNRVLSAPGPGPFSACCFTFLLQAKPFESADAIRAFVGLDLRVEDSGKKRGLRFITKRGDRILRYAATCAAKGLLNSRYGKNVNEQLKAIGRKHPERLVIAARKVIRTLFALEQNKTTFNPEKFTWRVDAKT